MLAGKRPAKKAPAKKTTAKKTTAKKTTAKKTTAKKAPAKKSVAKKTTAKKTTAEEDHSPVTRRGGGPVGAALRRPWWAATRPRPRSRAFPGRCARLPVPQAREPLARAASPCR